MVVADASPLNYLILIRLEQLLYGEVWIPPAVQQELLHPNAPALVRNFMESLPAWLCVQEPSATDTSLAHLDEGEAAAILLAVQLKAPALLIDERAGAHAPRHLGLNVTGTLGVLDEAAPRNLINLRAALDDLRQTTFRMSDRLHNCSSTHNPSARSESVPPHPIKIDKTSLYWRMRLRSSASWRRRESRHRLRFLDELDKLITNPETKEAAIHTALATNLWVFGAEFSLVVSNMTLATILKKYTDEKFTGPRSRHRPDLLLLTQLGQRYKLVEFKRPSYTLNRRDLGQAGSTETTSLHDCGRSTCWSSEKHSTLA